MIKIIWALIGLNTLALVFFIGAYFVMNSGKNVDATERSWTIVLAGLGLFVILLAAIPLRLSQSTGTLIFSGLVAAMPLATGVGVFISKQWPAKKEKSFAETYYEKKEQLAIAWAIENNDTLLLQQLLKGADLNIQGSQVWGWPGLNYLQFAIRLRSYPNNHLYNEAANQAAIRILLQHGCAATPALAEATKYLSPEMVAELISAGADPVKAGYGGPHSLLFEALGTTKRENDIVILLVNHGANLNVKDDYGKTLLMAAALNAGTSSLWQDTWRLVYYLLQEAKADHAYVAHDGRSFAQIIRHIRREAAAQHINMPPDFDKVVAWLKAHDTDTIP